MLFSFIVPVYNIENFLPQCMASLLGQSFREFEVILVNDGSTDGSGKMCDDYAKLDARVHVLHKKNGGQTSARKAGVSEAKGDYIIPVDGDDWIGKELVKDLKEIVEKYQPEIICYGFYRALDTGKMIEVENVFLGGFYDRERIVQSIFPDLIKGDSGKCFPPGVCGKAYKRELYEQFQGKVNEKIRIGEDLVVTYSCVSHAKSIYILDSRYYYYRLNTQSVTRQRKAGYAWKEVELIVQALEENMSQAEYNFEEQLKRYYCRRLFSTAKSHLQTSENYWKKRSEIIQHLSETQNQYYIKNARFNNAWKEKFAQFALKYKLVFLMKIYVEIEKR